MIWAGLAVFLRKQPVRRQAVVFGVCCGLFIAAGANSTHRSPAIGTVALWAVVAAVLTGLAYYLGVRGGVRRAGQDADAVRSAWVNAAFAVASEDATAAENLSQSCCSPLSRPTASAPSSRTENTSRASAGTRARAVSAYSPASAARSSSSEGSACTAAPTITRKVLKSSSRRRSRATARRSSQLKLVAST